MNTGPQMLPGATRRALRAARAATRRSAADRGLPATRIRRDGVPIDAAHLSAYREVCCFPAGDRIPASYPHVLAFPLSTYLLSDPAFPVPLLGLVHLHDRVQMLRPIARTDLLDIEVTTAGLREHRRGTQFDVLAEASVDGAPVWRGTSTYLHRHRRPDPRGGEPQAGTGGDGAPAGDHGPGGEGPACGGGPGGDGPGGAGGPGGGRSSPAEVSTVWRVDGGAGARYARVSGDRNPIHLSRLAARVFGFDRPIAHGMYTAARCLAALEHRLPPCHALDVDFRAPLPLPGTVTFTAVPDGSDPARVSLLVRVADRHTGRSHLSGTVTGTRTT